MCEIIGLMFIIAIPIYLLGSLAELLNRSSARDEARRIIAGKKKFTVKSICKIIDQLRLTSTKKPRKYIPEKDLYLIERLRMVRDKIEFGEK